MATQGVKRKLTAILSADVEGYSRLMEEDGASMAGIADIELLKKSPFQFNQYDGKISTDSIVGRLNVTIDGK